MLASSTSWVQYDGGLEPDNIATFITLGVELSLGFDIMPHNLKVPSYRTVVEDSFGLIYRAVDSTMRGMPSFDIYECS